jgi:serine acetyltransferase
MIKSKEDLYKYIKEDCKANLGTENISNFKLFAKLCFGSESASAFCYLKALRKYEYAINCLNDNIINKCYLLFCQYRWRRYAFKYGINIQPNMIGYGFYMPHIIGVEL